MATYTGTWAHDTFVGTSGNDSFVNIQGGDTVDGAGGDDTISIDLGYTDIATNYNAIAAATITGTAPLQYMFVKNVEHLGTLVTGGGNDSLTISAAQGAYTWHAGAGTDTLKLDFSNATTGMATDNTVDGYETRVNPWGDTVLGLATDIERVQITGSQYGDFLRGLAGNDILNGGAGDDFLDSGGGKDVIDGGAGYDRVGLNYSSAAAAVTYDARSAATASGFTLADGTVVRNVESFDLTTNGGDDTVMVSTAQKDFLWIANGGNDHLDADYSDSSAGITVTWLASTPLGPDLRIVTAEMALHQNANAYNVEAADIVGSKFADSIQGTNGTDWLDGGLGTDTLAGGKGDDHYYVDNAGDIVTEAANAGNDEVISSAVSYTLSANVENLTLGMSRGSVATAVDGTGNTLANVITGNANANTLSGLEGNDTLNGFDGNDVLNGGAGKDIMAGGNGNDTYWVADRGDVVTELAGQGTDTVMTWIDYNLGANVENLIMRGTSSINGQGNELNNTLTGNAANNTLSGLAGDDILDGKAGADIMNGGQGNDTFYVDNIHDVIGEYANAGTDTVIASVTYSLAGINAENLTLTGSANLDATGNSLVNVLVGNNGNNVLDGGYGNDTLTGGHGADTFVFGTGSGKDTITDYSAAEGDKINVHAYAGHASAVITQHGADTIITLGSGTEITVLNTHATDAAFLHSIIW